MILQKKGIKNYKRYIDNMFMNRKIYRNILIEIDLRAKKFVMIIMMRLKKTIFLKIKFAFIHHV